MRFSQSRAGADAERLRAFYDRHSTRIEGVIPAPFEALADEFRRQLEIGRAHV